MSWIDDTKQIIEDAPTEAQLLKQVKLTNEIGQKKVDWVFHKDITIYFEPVSRVSKGYGFDYDIAGIKEKKLYYVFMLPDVDIDLNDKIVVDGEEYLVYDVNKFPDHIEVFLTKGKRANL